MPVWGNAGTTEIKQIIKEKKMKKKELYYKVLYVNIILCLLSIGCNIASQYVDYFILDVVGWVAFAFSMIVVIFAIALYKKEKKDQTVLKELSKPIKVLLVIVSVFILVEIIAIISFVSCL